ncbi:MAG: redoxin domain-containing protein [Chloroflexi bacterium]|nr:redoxin domain-containing protein [Chloroflexota bacterium]
MAFDVEKYRRERKAEQERLDALAPKEGDIAPDFELYDVNGENPVRLSDFRGQKPVALIFGSYT